MGRSGKKSMLASLFGFKNKRQQQEEEAAAAARQQQQQRYYGGTRVRPSDDDDYYGRHWYADRDIDRKASEFIGRVRRGMLTDDQDG